MAAEMVGITTIVRVVKKEIDNNFLISRGGVDIVLVRNGSVALRNGNILHIVVVRFVLCGEPFACFQGIGGIADGFGCGLRHHRDVIVIPPWFGRRRVR